MRAVGAILGWVALLCVSTAALLVTLNRALDPPFGMFSELIKPFTPIAAPVHLACLVVAGILALRSVGTARRIAASVATAGGVALVLHATWLAPLYLGPPADSEAAGLTVATVNLQFGQADTAQLMALTEDVEILSLQEVTQEAWDELDAAGASRRWPYSAGTVSQTPAGSVIYSRYPLGRTDSLDTRFTMLTARISTPQAGLVEIVAAHPVPPFRDNAKEWADDHAQLLERVQRAQDGDADVVVVAGDLNATLDHVPVRRLQEAGLEDAAVAAKTGLVPTWPVGLGIGPVPIPPMITIDHVLSDGARATSVEIHTVGGTDHRAMVVELKR